MSTLEMEPSSPLAPNIIEMPERGQHADALREIYTLSDEVVAELRPQLWEAAEIVASQVVDPAQQSAIAMYAAVADWHVFGKPGEPMPKGLVLSVDQKGGQEARLDSRIAWLNYSIFHVDSKLRQVGLNNVIRQTMIEISQKHDQIKAIIEDIIRDSAEYQLLASFDQPISKPESSLLTPFWRRIREGQIEQDVKDRYGLDATRPIPVGTDAARDFDRQVYHLDDETMIQPQHPTSQHQGLLRARNFLTGYVQQAFEARENNHEFKDVYYDEGNGVMIRGTDYQDENDGDEFFDYAGEAAKILSGEIYVGSPELQEFCEIFVDYAILRIMDPRTSGNLQPVLEGAITEAVNYMELSLRDGIAPNFQSFGSSYSGGAYTLMLRGKNGEKVSAQEISDSRIIQKFGNLNWDSSMRGQSQISSRSELIRDLRTPLAHIETYGPPNFRVPSRLLLESSMDTNVAKEHDQEDLVLTSDDLQLHSVTCLPMIPGYRLVSRRADSFKSRYGFVVSPDGDPYRECKVVINEKRRNLLSDVYQSIGLQSLAQKVKGKSRLTVAQLTEMVQKDSVYYLLDELQNMRDVSSFGEGPLDRRIVYKDVLTDFDTSVQDGKLLVQCTGAAHFLRYSLERVFGNGCAGVASGFTISNSSSEVSIAQHAQTVFTYNGKQYLLDATPSYNIGLTGNPLDMADGRAQRRTAANAPHLDHARHGEAKLDMAIVPDQHQTLEEDIADQIQSLTKRLMVVFDAPNETALFNELVKLPKHDPVRTTFELLVQFAAGRLSDEQVFSVVDYIRNFANSTPESREKLGMGHYRVELLDQLEGATWHLKWAIKNERESSS